MRTLLLSAVAFVVLTVGAEATPGAVNKRGCHAGHCHTAGQISSARRHRYVPCYHCGKHKAKHRRKHR